MSMHADDGDRTRVRSGHSVPAGGADGSSNAAQSRTGDDAHALPIGTRLNEFELTQRIGEGGFSIVYLAWDHSLDRKVALKEYMPGALAARVGERQIQPRSERHRETFEAGLKSFVNEAKLLARFDHPALVKVYRFWEANGTAYLVMPLYDGMTLKDAVRAMPQPPGEDWLRALLAPLTEALGVIHAEHCYHRDIAPDNIMLLAEGGKPLLLDFGAARRVIGDMTQALTVILKPGYAPVEQYAEVPGMKQGPWTDVYALAATVYWMILGRTPPPSVARMLADSYEPLAQAAAGRYSAGFLGAIDRALAVLPERRTQTIDALRAELGLGATLPRDTGFPGDPDATVIRTRATTVGGRSGDRSSNRSSASASQPRSEARPFDTPNAPDEASERPAKADSHRTRVRLGTGLAVCAVLGAMGWWALKPAPTPATAKIEPPAAAKVEPRATAQVEPPATAKVEPPTTAKVEPRATAKVEPPAAVQVEPPATAKAEPPTTAKVEPPTQAAPRSPPAPSLPEVASVKPAQPTPSRTRGAIHPGASRAKSPDTERKVDATVHGAECARIYQQLSLGANPTGLMERAKELGCR